jgi:hypothetical protein
MTAVSNRKRRKKRRSAGETKKKREKEEIKGKISREGIKTERREKKEKR